MVNNKFNLITELKPQGSQPEAIKELTEGILKGEKMQTLLGVTGSGKTFTIANVIKNVNKPTLVLLCAKTNVGLFTFLITLAIVKVLPLPVTPSKVCIFSPFNIPSVSSFIASGCEPCGFSSVIRLNLLFTIINQKILTL